MSYGIGFRKMVSHAQLPKRARVGDVGFDLFSCEDKIIPARQRKPINTGIQLFLPNGHSKLFTSFTNTSIATVSSAASTTASVIQYYGRIAPRSGLSAKGLDVCAGVIDPNYEGSLGVILHNHTDSDFAIKQGDRVAQLIVERTLPFDAPVYEVCADNTTSLVQNTNLHQEPRGAQGFGSSGK